MRLAFTLLIVLLLDGIAYPQNGQSLVLNNLGYFEKRGLNVMVFSNSYDSNFSDAKISGIELIHHGVRTATNGDVRLSPTPGQWDPIPLLVKRTVDKRDNTIEVSLRYPDYDFDYDLQVQALNGGVLVSVILKKPVPRDLEGRAGLNLEFLPSAYFEKTYLMDGQSGLFPLYPSGSMEPTRWGTIDPMPLASGKSFVLAPEDPARQVTIQSKAGDLLLYDGRNLAQNGWYVVRTLLPAGKTGTVIQWFVSAHTIPNWSRTPVIEHSQVGYIPSQKKVAVLEFDKNDHPGSSARLLKVDADGSVTAVYSAELHHWGEFLRYNYFTFDFSSVKETGIYRIEYDSLRTKPFRIAGDVYDDVWHPTLDVYFPVQMDHMFVREAYRVWHGASHLDDALQAPVNHEHFDLYAQGPTTDSPYKPGEHIPGLNVGGWFDAGDYDIRTQTQCSVILNLVQTWETFAPKRDETTINERTRYVEIHRPDGVPDILQQIEHGVLQLLGQQRSVGHAINGIIASHLYQYRHLGDASTKTDNLVYNPKLDSLQSDGFTSGTFDDRWAFTSKSTPLNYASAAALAAASRALRGYNDSLAEECLQCSKNIWMDEQSHRPDLFRHGNTTGGSLEGEEFAATVELLMCAKEARYAARIKELLPAVAKRFFSNALFVVEAMPFMDSAYAAEVRTLVKGYRVIVDTLAMQNPFGVPISTGGWAGSGWVVGSGITNYVLYRAFPDIVDPEYTYRCLDYVYGCHPGSDLSFVSDVGTVSKKVAYGNNRADFTFIAGGVAPGVLIVKPDFPENKEDWPFLWAENEYVVGLGASYIYLANAVVHLSHR